MSTENLKTDALRGKVPASKVSVRLTTPEYDVGDRVYLHLGQAGTLGPGRVSEFLHFANEEMTFLGYNVTFTLEENREVSLGYFHGSFLSPAEEA